MTSGSTRARSVRSPKAFTSRKGRVAPQRGRYDARREYLRDRSDPRPLAARVT
jgi:hypothetical protein